MQIIDLARARLRSWLRRVAPGPMHRRALSHRQHDEVEEALLPVVVDPSRETVDVGANVGSYAVRLSRCSPLVHAFEPDLELATFLARAGYPNIRVTAAALSRTAGEATLHVPIVASGPEVSRASLDAASIGDLPVMATQRVPTDTLDRLAERNIGFVKIDVEGHELAVLEGGTQLIERQRPLLLIEAEERHAPGVVAAVSGFLAGFGYHGFFVLGDRTYALSEFTPDMQDPAQLRRPLPRRQIPYVNNFFFASSTNAAAAARSAIDQVLATTTRGGAGVAATGLPDRP